MLEQLLKDEGPRGLAIIGVTASASGMDHQSPASMEDLKQYAQRFGVTFPLLFDASLAQARAYKVESYPTLYLLDKTGRIAWSGVGEASLDDLKGAVAKVL